MKKRILLLALAALLALTLVACKSEQAQMVDDQIAKLGKVTLKSGAAIVQLETLVEKMSAKEQGQLENLQKLWEARAEFDALVEEQNQGYIKKVEDVIKKIGTVDLDSWGRIEDALEAYEDLPEALRPRVSNYQVLVDAQQAYRDAEQALLDSQIAEVRDAINAIGEVTLNSWEAISNAIAVCEKYDAQLLQQVDNYSKLEEACTAYTQLRIDHVITLIDAIGEVTLESEQLINDAKTAYNALSKDEKQMVTNYQVLTDASAKFKELKDAKDKQDKLDLARSLFRVKRLYIGGHDSVGGVNVYFDFVNLSDKEIKYVNFSFSFYNSVGDYVRDEFGQSTRCYYTGPVKKGEGTKSGWCWGKYYNWEIARVELDSLSLEYMDGTKVYFNDDQIAHITY